MLGAFIMFESVFFRNRSVYTVFLLGTLLLGTAISGNAYAKRSPEEVFKYQKHMAQAGYSSAIYKLAVMYQNGYGTPRDLKQALKLYKDSAKLGYKKAESRISEVEIMLESGDFKAPKISAQQKALEQEQARLKAEKEKLRKERAALNKNQREARAARLEAQRQQRQLANAQRRTEQQRIIDERRKLNAEMAELRAEKARLAKEKKDLIAAKEQAAENEMQALEASIELLMDDGMTDEERATAELMAE